MESDMRERRSSVVRYAVITAFLLIIFLFQTTDGLLPRIGDASAWLVFPAVICIGMFEREAGGAFFGLAAGLMLDTVSSQLFGFYSIFLMLAGCCAGLLITYLMRSGLLTGLLLAFICLFLYAGLHWGIFIAFKGYDGGLSLFFSKYIPSVFYSLLFLPVFYYLFRFISTKTAVQGIDR